MTYYVSLHHWWTGALTFAAAYAAHVALWRLVGVRREVVWLAVLFLLVPSAGYVAYGGFAAGLFHFLLSANYIAIYPAFQASSPTIQILNLVRRSGAMTPEEITARVRLEPPLTGGLLRDGKLTRRGERIADLFTAYRRLIGLPPGRG